LIESNDDGVHKLPDARIHDRCRVHGQR
jgi:hypothetical protein